MKKKKNKDRGIRKSDFDIPESAITFFYNHLKKRNLLPKNFQLSRDYWKMREITVLLMSKSISLDAANTSYAVCNVYRVEHEISWYKGGKKAIVLTSPELVDMLEEIRMDDVRMKDALDWEKKDPDPFMLVLPKKRKNQKMHSCLVCFTSSLDNYERTSMDASGNVFPYKASSESGKYIVISLWGDEGEGVATYPFDPDKTVNESVGMVEEGLDSPSQMDYLTSLLRLTLATTAYMKACPHKVRENVCFLEDDRKMSFRSFSKVEAPDLPSDSGEGSSGGHKSPHFRRWHLRRHPQKKDGTRTEGLILVSGCAVGFGKVAAVEK